MLRVKNRSACVAMVAALGPANLSLHASFGAVTLGLVGSAALAPAAAAQDLDPEAVSELAALYEQFTSNASSGQLDAAEQAADELVRKASNNLEALRAAVDAGSIDRAALGPLMAQPSTEDAALRVDLRILDALAEPLSRHYTDFAHFTRVARPDQALGFGQQLVADASPEVLLHVIELSRYGDDPIFEAKKIDQLSEVATSLEDLLEQGRLNRATEPDRIRAAINRLGQGRTAYTGAVRLLRQAGQYAAPEMLAALGDDNRTAEHPIIRDAMIDVGRPLVQPLSVALPELPVATAYQVADVLGKIGYPEAAPALRARLDDDTLPARARQVVSQALDAVVGDLGLSSSTPTALLNLAVGERYYGSGTRGDPVAGIDETRGVGNVWYWAGDTVRPRQVPTAIYPDVLAMFQSLDALKADPTLDDALSLFIKSNYRRENRLGEGIDQSYPASMQEPSFYAAMAGPERLLDVLNVALNDGDGDLALDAIAALQATSAAHVLADAGPNAPLLRALNDSDRRVRFNAALAMAGSRPTATFAGYERVVPVLAEAARQSNERTALVLAGAQTARNELAAAAEAAGFAALPAASLSEASPMLSAAPGIDAVIVSGTLADVTSAVSASRDSYRLSTAPILAVAPDSDAAALRQMTQNIANVAVVTADDDLSTALNDAVDTAGGTALGDEESEAVALDAIEALRLIALTGTDGVFNIDDAVPALVAALGDARPDVAAAAAGTLAVVNSAEAQASLIDAVEAADFDLQLTLLGALADSAKQFGNLLNGGQVDEVRALVAGDDPELALAAAAAHGALALPTASAVDLLNGN